MEIKELICIGCPLGCSLKVEMENGQVKSVSGNTCPRGDAYARKEVVNPTRIVTSTVKVTNGDRPYISVKTKTDIPKSKIFECMKEINNAVVEAPVSIGDVIIEDVANTGVSVIATRNAFAN